MRTCDLDGCDRPHNAKGMCSAHYQRAKRNNGYPGDVHVGIQRNPRVRELTGLVGENHPRWVGDNVTYMGMHKRLLRQYGHPSEYPCKYCGRVARDWAYDHGDEGERYYYKPGRTTPLLYSTDPEYYMPLCRSCHHSMDVILGLYILGAELTEEEAQALRPEEYGQ